MATPANRVPVRIARGTKANLDTAMAAGDLKEGEICYATDENAVYVVEGGALEQAGASLSTESVNALQDVDTTTAAPTDGQALVWVDANGAWEPRDLAIDSLEDLGNVASGATDEQVLRYNTAASEWRPTNLPESPSRIQDQTDFELNEDADAITIYTFDTDGTDPGAESGKINSYKAVGFLYISTTTNTGDAMPIPWPSLTFWWRYTGDPTWTQTSADSASSRTEGGRTFFDLQRSGGESTWPDDAAPEVELVFQDPANLTYLPLAEGDVLRWVDADQKFKPAQLSAAPVESVNGETGAVSLGIQDMDDFALSYADGAAEFSYLTLATTSNFTSLGDGAFVWTEALFKLKFNDSFGADAINPVRFADPLWVSGDNKTWHELTGMTWVLDAQGISAANDGSYAQIVALASAENWTEAYFRTSGEPSLAPLADDDILVWNATDSKFKPGAISLFDLSDVQPYDESANFDGTWIRGNNISTVGPNAAAATSTSTRFATVTGGVDVQPYFAAWAPKVLGVEYPGTAGASNAVANVPVVINADGVEYTVIVTAIRNRDEGTYPTVQLSHNNDDGGLSSTPQTGIMFIPSLREIAESYDGKFIQYDAAEGLWKPAEVGGGSTGLPTTGGTMTGDVTFDGGSGTTIEILADGRVNVGPSGGIYSYATYDRISISDPQGPRIAFGRDDSETVDGDLLGAITFNGNDSDGNYEECASILAEASSAHSTSSKPSLLKFYTTNTGGVAPTARAQLRGDGRFDVYTEANGINARTSATAGTSNHFFAGWSDATTLINGTVQFRVWSNGDVINTNNSYGAISDVTLKENITPASVQWENIKAIEVVNYNFKEETGRQTHKQLGVIAQQVEEVSPGLVATGEDGLKSVNYSVLYMKAVKALQEAMERIEVLEQRLNDAGID